MKIENSSFPILYWPRKSTGDTDYQMARRLINQTHNVMPEVLSKDLDIAEFFAANPSAVLYYPIFPDSTGWWGELLGSNAGVSGKIIISSECQLMEIRNTNQRSTQVKNETRNTNNQLLAAEIYPTSGFFKKMNSGIATVSDMLATDTGSILALFSGKNQNKFVQILESTGNSYLGCIGAF